MTYGSALAVRKMFRPNEEAITGDDLSDRIQDALTVVSRQIDTALGRTFGQPATDTDVLVWAGSSNVVLLPRPARTITSVSVGGTVSGVTVSDGTVYDSELYAYYPYDPETGLIYGLVLNTGGWWGITNAYGHYSIPVVVTGDFSTTDDDTTVPPDIHYAANLLALRTLQREAVGVAGVSGEDGSFRPPMDPWKDPTVQRIIDTHRVITREWAM
jgi:hypothetical protein